MKPKQLALNIERARKRMTPRQVTEHVIGLYGAELEKANAEISKLRKELINERRKHEQRNGDAPRA